MALVAIGGAIAAAVLRITLAFVLPIVVPMWIGQFRNTSGAATASIGSGSIFAAAFVGFLIDVVWAIRHLGTT